MDKTDYLDKMDALVNDKQTYEELKRDYTADYTIIMSCSRVIMSCMTAVHDFQG